VAGKTEAEHVAEPAVAWCRRKRKSRRGCRRRSSGSFRSGESVRRRGDRLDAISRGGELEPSPRNAGCPLPNGLRLDGCPKTDADSSAETGFRGDTNGEGRPARAPAGKRPNTGSRAGPASTDGRRFRIDTRLPMSRISSAVQMWGITVQKKRGDAKNAEKNNFSALCASRFILSRTQVFAKICCSGGAPSSSPESSRRAG